MSTPVLTKQQQRLSLSAKKSSTKGLRNVLAQPQDSYWPVVTAEKLTILEEILKKLMPAMKRPSHEIPWSQLRHMKKEERSQAKREALSKQEIVPDTEIMNSVVLGLNAVTRSVEKNNVCCILMDDNIEPRLLTRHIIIMAQNKKVPILLLPNFKAITLSTIGFASAACALKNIVMESPNNYFHSLYLQAYDIYKDIPLPIHSIQLFKDTEILYESMPHKDEKMNIEDESEFNSQGSIKFTLSTNVYKYRTSRKERAFIPPTETESLVDDTVATKDEGNDFISLGNYHADECGTNFQRSRYVNLRDFNHTKKEKNRSNTKSNSTNVTYLPLKVKRLQGNSNRVKATKATKQKKK